MEVGSTCMVGPYFSISSPISSNNPARRFLLHHPAKQRPVDGSYEPRIQQLEIWDPSDGDLALFE
jgi:hypothetical protein